jgi:hypothetical protein
MSCAATPGGLRAAGAAKSAARRPPTAEAGLPQDSHRHSGMHVQGRAQDGTRVPHVMQSDLADWPWRPGRRRLGYSLRSRRTASCSQNPDAPSARHGGSACLGDAENYDTDGQLNDEGRIKAEPPRR